jgi:DNA-binding transcriptional ArsR family regulator
MSVKYKMGFTISAETVFHLLSKLLPIDDLHVEEVIERLAPDPAIRFDKRFDLPKPVKPKFKPKQYKRKPSKPMSLTEGINGIIMTHLSDGMGHAAMELRKPLKAAGYSESSVSSRIEELRKHGVVEKLGQGTWRLTDPYLPATGTTGAGPK